MSPLEILAPVGAVAEAPEPQTVLAARAAELALSRQRIVQTEERVRREVAELLHGRVQSRLLVAWHRLGCYEELAARDPAAAARLVAEVRQEIDRIREHDVRAASHLLHPAIVQIGLVPALAALADQFGGALRVEVRLDEAVSRLDDPLDNAIPEDLRLTLYRVLEEALNNVARHAGVSRADVHVALEGGTIRMTVSDEGRGFEPDGARRGLGLSSIADRVDQANGAWSIASAPGRGTTLTVRVPLHES